MYILYKKIQSKMMIYTEKSIKSLKSIGNHTTFYKLSYIMNHKQIYLKKKNKNYPNILRDLMVLCKGSLLKASKLFYYSHNKQTNFEYCWCKYFFAL